MYETIKWDIEKLGIIELDLDFERKRIVAGKGRAIDEALCAVRHAKLLLENLERESRIDLDYLRDEVIAALGFTEPPQRKGRAADTVLVKTVMGWSLLKAGIDYRQVGSLLGVDRTSVYHYYNKCSDAIKLPDSNRQLYKALKTLNLIENENQNQETL